MGKCEKCGNDYDNTFVVEQNNEQHTFDSFECAISMMAPRCKHCNCAIIGHGVQVVDNIYCCAHCAHESEPANVKDRVYKNEL
ncbi:MAG: hypothetical protein H0V01_08360 [Bacteroidetes bacterium]|nr:hypothetical protein [Bacteroidota bacterium]HET6243720.1 hypothetical protein [Bacteroidia bacterium]